MITSTPLCNAIFGHVMIYCRAYKIPIQCYMLSFRCGYDNFGHVATVGRGLVQRGTRAGRVAVFGATLVVKKLVNLSGQKCHPSG